MRTAPLVLTSALVVSFGAAAGLVAYVVLPPQIARADSIDDQIAALKAEKDEGKIIAKLEEMRGSITDPKVFVAIKSFCWVKSEKVSCAAIKMVAGTKDVEFYKWMAGKVDDKDVYDKKDGRPESIKAILEALVPFGDKNKSLLKPVEKLIDKFLPTDAEYSTRLIHLYGSVHDKFAVIQLLKWGDQTDAKNGGQGGGGGGGKGGISAETRDNHNKARTAIMQTLTEITGQDLADIAAWHKWWTENEKTFKFVAIGAGGGADPGAAGPAAPTIDPKGAEFKDEGYGFSIKRPEGDWWTFAKADYTADETPRVMLTCADPDNRVDMRARAYLIIHPCKNPPPDVKGMVKWALEDAKGPYKTQLEFDEKHAPTTEELKLGGAEWTVIKCKGNGIGNRKGWGSQERRFYFTKIDANSILYIDSVCGLGADDDVKKAFWNALETITLPPKKK